MSAGRDFLANPPLKDDFLFLAFLAAFRLAAGEASASAVYSMLLLRRAKVMMQLVTLVLVILFVDVS